MKYSHPRRPHQYGIVDLVPHGIPSLVAPHSPHVAILTEVHLVRVDGLTRHAARRLHRQVSMLMLPCRSGASPTGWLWGGSLQSIHPHLRSHITEDHGSHLAVNLLDATYRRQSLNPDIRANSQLVNLYVQDRIALP